MDTLQGGLILYFSSWFDFGPDSSRYPMLTSFIEALIYGHPLTRLQLLRPIEVLMRLDKP